MRLINSKPIHLFKDTVYIYIVLARAYIIRFKLISCFLPCYIYLVNFDNRYTF